MQYIKRKTAMDLGLKSKTAVIFGGGRGLGFATAKLMAAEGAAIGLVDYRADSAEQAADQLKSQFGIKCASVSADIGNYEAVVKARDALAEKLGTAHIMINSAAVDDQKYFLDSGPADWKRVIDTCLYGTIHCVHAYSQAMAANGGGRIICLASDSGRMGQARLSYYAAAKAGVIALCKSVAQELGRNGVAVNVVSPGATNTEMRKEREAILADQLGPAKYEERTKKVLRLYPLGRLGEPEDIASAIAFLASERASWVTGQVLSVNGGFAMP
jgi:NAD(P)-dependent dehydrogenase (short-subunit alcohol dehydrogenase family)